MQHYRAMRKRGKSHFNWSTPSAVWWTQHEPAIWGTQPGESRCCGPKPKKKIELWKPKIVWEKGASFREYWGVEVYWWCRKCNCHMQPPPRPLKEKMKTNWTDELRHPHFNGHPPSNFPIKCHGNELVALTMFACGRLNEYWKSIQQSQPKSAEKPPRRSHLITSAMSTRATLFLHRN